MIRILIAAMLVVALLVAVAPTHAQCGPGGCSLRPAARPVAFAGKAAKRVAGKVRGFRLLPRNRR